MVSSTTIKIICLAIIAMVVVNGPVAEALSCGDVARYAEPCFTYLKSGGTVPSTCCDGMKSLVSAAQTPADRQAVCKCLKAASGGVNLSLAAGLPGTCGVSIPYKLSPSTDCNTVK